MGFSATASWTILRNGRFTWRPKIIFGDPTQPDELGG